MTKLTRNGIVGIFSDADIKSGQPQRYGWTEEGKEKKTLPKEIIQFIERKKAPEPKKDEVIGEVKSDFATGGMVNETITEPIESFATETVIPTLPTNVQKLKDKKIKDKFAEAGAKAGEKVKEVTTPKAKKNDNPKQKDRPAAKRKPGRVAKN